MGYEEFVSPDGFTFGDEDSLYEHMRAVRDEMQRKEEEGRRFYRKELKPIPGTQKSFNGRAYERIVPARHVAYLESYGAIICSCFTETGMFIKYTDFYSRTTMRHINAFRKKYGLPSISKTDWDDMPVSYLYSYIYDNSNLIEEGQDV